MCRPFTRTLLVMSCAAFLLAASGCSLFRSGVQDILVAEPLRSLPEINEPPTADALVGDPLAGANEAAKAASDVPSCYIEIQPSGKKRQRIRMSLEDASNVQAVLNHTGLIKKFKNMQIELSRKSQDGTLHKLEIRYDADKNRVVPLFDYALHPNDLLVIRQDSSTSLDKMLKKLAGPLAR